MIYLVIAVIGLTLGLYAGKRRAKGKDWCQILCDLFFDLRGALCTFMVHLTNPFRAEQEVAKADGQPE